MICDRCKEEIALIKPLNTCNIVTGEDYGLSTYILCRRCTDALFGFLGEKTTNRLEYATYCLGVDLANAMDFTGSVEGE